MSTNESAPAVTGVRGNRPVVWTGLSRLGLFLFTPSKYFASLGEPPYWFAPFVVCAVTMILTAWGTLPFVLRGLEAAIPAGIPPDRLETVLHHVQTGQYLGLILSPLILLLKLTLGAVFLTTLCQLVLVEGEFRRVFSLVVHVMPFSALQALHSVLVLRIRGLETVRSPMDVQVSLGLNLIIRNSSPAIEALLQNINLYEILAFSYLVIGIRTFFHCRRATAASIGVIYWVVGTALVMAMSVIAKDLQTPMGG